MSGDSDLSASELRARYAQGGSLKDSELSAAQLRARHGIAANRKDFSTAETAGAGNASFLLVLAVAVIVIAVGGYFMLLQK